MELPGAVSGDELLEAGAALDPRGASRPPAGGRRAASLALGALAAVALTAAAAARWARPAARGGGLAAGGVVTLQEEEGEGAGGDDGAPAACAPLDGECTQSKCCADGGGSGYQCYAKNDDWAVCLESCQEGAHEDETDGEYDQYGQFQKFEWSCKKLGDRSLPACGSFESKKKCDPARCTWTGEACRETCSLFASAEECSTDSCTWDEACIDACSTFGNASACPSERCEWLGDSCVKACWKMSPDSCDDSRCILGDEGCQVDPCSAPGEDCSKTKCCSADRGGQGMTCFKKDSTWASCSEECVKEGGPDGSKWSCAQLGNRTPMSVSCAWGGDDCSKTKCCANDGFTCIKKDELFSGCQQTTAKTTWVTKQVEVPADWDGTVLGYGHGESQCRQAGEGEAVAGTSLYCFVAIIPDSSEAELMQVAEQRNAGMYACDAHDLFHSWESGSAGWDTGESTLVNTDVFIKIFSQVKEKGTFLKHDWTIKADADCVFVPDRVRGQISSFNPPASTSIYLKNNGQDPDLGNHGFLGAIEIFSRKAMQMYFDNAEGCEKFFGLGCGEDGFFKGCMDALEVCFVPAYDIFFPDNGAGACLQENRAAFHPLKTKEKWNECLDLLEGKAAWQQQQ